MTTATVDSRGRVYIPKEMRENYGDKYRIVKLESGIKLIPVSEDPVEDLKDAMNSAKDVEIEDISRKTEKMTREELKEEF